ncbi:lipopolysaccharide biosynthesis protein [Paraburkholderia bannensis]|uniref:lipopolysaccharide biosynthesis protein n=1 Tax=Paraburkholderia bannensis TaxID=765414 RepID=UPI002AB2EB86|nr:oligosaccharide flippase family protein [Paraburkholderia bannensis]
MIKQALHLTIGNLVSRCVFAALTISLAKITSPESYGALSFAIAVTTVSSYFCDLGIQNTYLRDVSGGKPLWGGYTLASLYIRIFLYVPVCVISYLIFHVFIKSPVTYKCVALMFAPGVLGLALTSWISGALLSRSKMEKIALVRIKSALAQVVFVGGSALIPATGEQRIELLALGYGCGLLVGGFFGIEAVRLRKYSMTFDRFRHCARRLLHGLEGYVVSGLLYMLAPSIGVLILGRSSNLAVVGTFALAARVPQFLYTVPGAAGQSFYPKLFRVARSRDWRSFSELFDKEAKLLLPIGVSLALAVLMAAPLIAKVVGHSSAALYQAEFRKALLIGAGIIFMQCLSIPLGHVLETTGRTGLRTLGQIIALLVAIILFSSLGQEFGLVGAMIAAVVTEVVLYVSWMSFIFLKIHQTRVTRLLISGFLGAIFVTICGGAMWKIYT